MAYTNYNDFKDKKAYGYVYAWVSKQTKQVVYIGITNNLERREKEHVMNIGTAFDKYITSEGEENFYRFILCTGDSKEELEKEEERYISIFDTTKNGLNCTKGGKNGIIWNPNNIFSAINSAKSVPIDVYNYETGKLVCKGENIQAVKEKIDKLYGGAFVFDIDKALKSLCTGKPYKKMLVLKKGL